MCWDTMLNNAVPGLKELSGYLTTFGDISTPTWSSVNCLLLQGLSDCLKAAGTPWITEATLDAYWVQSAVTGHNVPGGERKEV